MCKIKASVGILIISVILLGAKCATNTKAVVNETLEINNKEEIIEKITELKEHSKEIEIINYDYKIMLLTFNELTFKEAVHLLKTKTNMNVPVYIFLRTDEDNLKGKGELKTKCTADRAVSLTNTELRPYRGIINIYDGYWSAREFNAYALFPARNGNNDTVLVTEYFYANENVYFKNDFSPFFGVLSCFDEGEIGGNVEGDGSIPHEIITEFDK